MPRRPSTLPSHPPTHLQGVGAARGLAFGQARIRQSPTIDLSKKSVPAADVTHQLERLHQAIDTARQEMHALRDRLRGALEREVGDILELHAMLIDDPELLQSLDTLIQTHRYTAEYALHIQRNKLASIFQEMEDAYLKSRMDDLDHVIARIYAFLQQRPPQTPSGPGDILMSDTIAPSELADLQAQGVVGIITLVGSPLSHSAIMARSLHLPYVVAVSDSFFNKVNDGDALLIDGSHGDIFVNPSAEDLRTYRARLRELAKEQRALDRLRHKPTQTADQIDITLRANAESEEDIANAYAVGAQGLGLYRSEFLFLHRTHLPDEEEQFQAYQAAVLAMNGRTVTIRTHDLGADKIDKTGLVINEESNPALGIRGIRLLLKYPNVLKTQLRAILRASGYGPVRILLSMITNREEVLRIRQLLSRLRSQLHEEGHKVAHHVPLGAMIEVPAAALAVRAFIEDIDFLSIGTNDLIQYLMAADRNNEAVAKLYTPLHPAVIQLLWQISQTAQHHQIPVCLCGEIANNPQYMPLFLTLGLSDFSLHPNTLLEIRRAISECHWEQLQQQAPRLLHARDRRSIKNWLLANGPTQ